MAMRTREEIDNTYAVRNPWRGIQGSSFYSLPCSVEGFWLIRIWCLLFRLQYRFYKVWHFEIQNWDPLDSSTLPAAMIIEWAGCAMNLLEVEWESRHCLVSGKTGHDCFFDDLLAPASLTYNGLPLASEKIVLLLCVHLSSQHWNANMTPERYVSLYSHQCSLAPLTLRGL